MPIPSIGQRLRVKTDELAKDCYVSRLVDVGHETLLIDVPRRAADNRVMEATAQPFWVEYDGGDGVLSQFKSSLQKQVLIPDALWQIASPKPSDITRKQRREFVRVMADIPVRVHVADNQENFDVFSRDISGGGLAIVAPRKLRLQFGTIVDIEFHVPTFPDVVQVRCEVMRMGERNELGYGVASLRFLEMKEFVRQRIIQYVYSRQRLLG